MKPKFKIGDKVQKWKSGVEDRLGEEIWTIIEIQENSISESGILLDVEIPKCPHCGHPRRSIVGYDSNWFVLYENNNR